MPIVHHGCTIHTEEVTRCKNADSVSEFHKVVFFWNTAHQPAIGHVKALPVYGFTKKTIGMHVLICLIQLSVLPSNLHLIVLVSLKP